MKAARKILIGLLQVTLLFSFVACESDPTAESSILTPGGKDPVPDGNPYWDWVDAFPGPVSTLITPVADAVVKVRGGYDPIVYSPETPALQSTGLWARSGDLIQVNVPADVENLWYQIGASQPLYDISIQKGQRRYTDVTVKGRLESGKVNDIKSNFGGFIYFFYEPGEMDPSPDYKEVIVNGAVEAMSYTYGVTDAVEYVRTIQERSTLLTTNTSTEDELAFVPWTELISDKVILTLNVKEMSLVANPQALLDVYGNIRDSYLEFAGFSTQVENQPPMRVVSDIQLPNPIQTSVENNNQDNRKWGGYPMVSLRHKDMRNGTAWLNERDMVNSAGQLEFQINATATKAFMHIHDSFGKTVFGSEDTRSWSYVVDLHYPLLRLAAIYYADKKLGTRMLPGDYSTPYNKIIEYNRFNNKFEYKQGYFIFTRNSSYTEQPHENDPYNKDPQNKDTWWSKPIQYDQGMTTMFLHLAKHYGWGLITYLFTRARDLDFENEYAQDAHDYVVMAACEYTNSNLMPFFQWYHFPMTVWATDFAKQFPTIPGTFQVNQSPYWFIQDSYPEANFSENPEINKPDLVPSQINPWPQKPFYKTITTRLVTDKGDSSKNQGWWVTNEFIFPTNVVDESAVNPTAPVAKKEELQRLIDNDYSSSNGAEWQNVRHTGNPQKTIRTPHVTVHFLNNHKNDPQTLNAIEFSVGGHWFNFGWISFVYGIEAFVPDDVNGSIDEDHGQWIPLNTNMDPDVSEDWYNGVVWTVPHRVFVDGGTLTRYAYFFDKTFENVTKIRFKMVPGLSNRVGNNGDNDGWTIDILEFKIGLVSTDNPKPPMPSDANYVPRYKYQGTMKDRGLNWQTDYESAYGTDPAPPGWKGWLHVGIRDYNLGN